MRLALIPDGEFELRDAKKEKPSLEEYLLLSTWEKASREQCLALAKFLQDGSLFEPCLICREGSSLAEEAARLSLPRLCLRSGKHFMDRFRLWRWQKKSPEMLILSLGTKALRVAAILHGMRRKNSTPLVCAFLLRPASLIRKQAKILARSSSLICGSEYIMEKLAQDLERYGHLSWPGSAIIAPGIDYERYLKASPWADDKGGNFVFGMAESLTSRSGALLTIRAMAAIWQKDDLPPFEVRMFGSGPRFGEILEEATNLGVQSRLSLLSAQDLSRVAGLCDAWLAPGSSHVELPGTLWAGFAAGLPVICGQSKLHAERLEGSSPDSVLIVEENNPQKLARAMISVMSDPKLRMNLVENGKSELDRIGLARMARETIWLLESLVSGKPAKPASFQDASPPSREEDPAQDS